MHVDVSTSKELTIYTKKKISNKLIRYVNIAVYLPKNSKCFLVKVDTYAKNSAESS